MNISVSIQEFIQAVGQVSRFAQRSSATLPALSGIAIIAGDDGIKLRATNLETGIDRKIEGTILTQGIVVIPATLLQGLATSFHGTGSITFEHSGETVLVTTATGKSVLKTLQAEDFPTLSFPQSPKTVFKIPGTQLKSLVLAAAPCASPSTVRPELASVFIQAEGGILKAVATDSFRLVEKQLAFPGKIVPFSMLIPAKNALDIMQVLPDDEVEVRVDEHQCVFLWGQGAVTTRLVTVAYPDYAQIIPKSFVSEITILKKDFETALRRTALFSDSFQKIRLSVSPGKKNLSLSARNSDVGESSEQISASITGDEIELSFNHRYLQSVLPLTTAESLVLSASGIGRALVIKGNGDNSLLYLVMPMNQ